MRSLVLSDELINFSALEAAPLHNQPFPYVVVKNFINEKFLSSLIDHFPSIPHRGSIPAHSVPNESLFKNLIQELEGEKLKNSIADKFTIDLKDKPVMTTLRATTTERDGLIHTDSRGKLITVLLYLNPSWPHEGGKLRLLNDKHSLENYFEEVSPLAGHCLIFKVTPNGWHGHKPFVGKRFSLQLNYLRSETSLTKHLNHHRFSALLKRWFPKLFQQNENY